MLLVWRIRKDLFLQDERSVKHSTHSHVLNPLCLVCVIVVFVTNQVLVVFLQTDLKVGGLLVRLSKILLHSVLVFLLTFTINYLTKVNLFFHPFYVGLPSLLFCQPWCVLRMFSSSWCLLLTKPRLLRLFTRLTSEADLWRWRHDSACVFVYRKRCRSDQTNTFLNSSSQSLPWGLQGMNAQTRVMQKHTCSHFTIHHIWGHKIGIIQLVLKTWDEYRIWWFIAVNVCWNTQPQCCHQGELVTARCC